MKALFCSTAAAALLVGSQPAFAQDRTTDSPPARPDAATGDDNAAKDDIIVTAQRRTQRLGDVPISISVISGDTLNDIAAKSGGSLQGLVPALNINVSASYGGSPVSIRGTSGLGGAEDPVAVYVDDVYTSSGQFSVTALSDVASVEVVRGPQGTLQGRNATAGALIIRTADPEFQFGGFVRASVEDPRAYRVEAAVTGPVSDTLAVRLSGDRLDERGWATNLFDGRKFGGTRMYNLRSTFLWRPSTAFRARLSLNYQDRIASQPAVRWGQTTIYPAPGPAVPAGTQTPQIPLTPAQEAFYLDNKVVNLNLEPRNRFSSPSMALNLQYDFGPVTLVSITGLSGYVINGQSDSDSLALTDRQGRNTGRYTGSSFSQEVRLQSSGKQTFDWILGYYYANYRADMTFDIYNYKLSTAIDQVSDFRSHQINPNWAVFADGTLHVSDTLSVIGGVRYTRDTKTFSNAFTLTNLDTNGVLAVLPFAAPKRTWSDTSYRAKIAWQPNRDFLGYVSYSKGFKAGGYNAFGVGAQPGYNPEVMKSWEVGFKASLADRRAFITGAVYDNSYDNLQVTSGVPTGGVVITNAAAARIRGFELEGDVKATPNLSFTANLAYIDGKFSSFPLAPDLLGILRDVSGNRLTNSPEWQYFLQTQYRRDLTDDVEVRGTLNWRWRDTIYFTPTDQNLEHLRGAPDGELGARLTLDLKPQKLSVSLYGTNLNDKRVVANEAITFSYPQAFFNHPRTVGIQVEKKF